jgi:flavin reductase (DIM6/NTAB) family NADH-FMN oxidoreductase RutF
MIILTVETFVVDGSVLSQPTELMKGRDVKAKIDAELIKPVVGLGNGTFSPLTGFRSMPRPKKQDAGGWISDPFDVSLPTLGEGEYEDMEWSYREHGAQCPLGYNPITALIMPRPIGWISTYKKEGRTLHLAPYSFFTDVSRGKEPMVAFSGARPGDIKKDAQKDSEEMGCFAYNMVSEDLAVAMNYSAAEMDRTESEFELAGLSSEKANLVDAPVVKDAHVKYECEYVKTVDVASFSIVIGKVVGVTVDKSILTDGRVDPIKARPILRMGYMDEYGVVSRARVQP